MWFLALGSCLTESLIKAQNKPGNLQHRYSCIRPYPWFSLIFNSACMNQNRLVAQEDEICHGVSQWLYTQICLPAFLCQVSLHLTSAPHSLGRHSSRKQDVGAHHLPSLLHFWCLRLVQPYWSVSTQPAQWRKATVFLKMWFVCEGVCACVYTYMFICM